MPHDSREFDILTTAIIDRLLAIILPATDFAKTICSDDNIYTYAASSLQNAIAYFMNTSERQYSAFSSRLRKSAISSISMVTILYTRTSLPSRLATSRAGERIIYLYLAYCILIIMLLPPLLPFFYCQLTYTHGLPFIMLALFSATATQAFETAPLIDARLYSYRSFSRQHILH